MPHTVTITQGYNIPAFGSGSTPIVITGDTLLSAEVTVPVAKVGSLTTRTDNDTGTLTMNTGHGITTASVIDLYWSGGKRRGMTVGTVAVDSVPIDGGLGDNLPVVATAITAMVRQEEVFAFAGSSAKVIAGYSSKRGTIVLALADNSEQYHIDITSDGSSVIWHDQSATANPVTGDAITKAFFTHDDSGTASTMRLAVVSN